MLFFRRKQPNVTPAPAAELPMTVMPDEFLPSAAAPATGSVRSPRSWLIAVAVVVFVAGGTAAVFYLFRDQLLGPSVTPTANSTNQTPPTANTVNTANVTSNVGVVNQPIGNQTNTNQPAANNSATNTPVINNQASGLPGGVTNTVNSTATSNISNANVAPTVDRSALEDSDGDGLTAAEEELWGTKSTFADSDTDGYPDGQELLAGYDPTRGSGQKLQVGGAIKQYVNRTQVYTVFYPKDFTARNVNQDESDVLLTAPSGEYVEVYSQDNRSRLSAVAWYQKLNPTASAAAIGRVNVAGAEAAISPDGRSVYVPHGDKMLTLVYGLASDGLARYPLTFRYMYQSLQFTVPAAPASNSNTPVANTARNAANTNSQNTNTTNQTRNGL